MTVADDARAAWAAARDEGLPVLPESWTVLDTYDPKQLLDRDAIAIPVSGPEAFAAGMLASRAAHLLAAAVDMLILVHAIDPQPDLPELHHRAHELAQQVGAQSIERLRRSGVYDDREDST